MKNLRMYKCEFVCLNMWIGLFVYMCASVYVCLFVVFASVYLCVSLYACVCVREYV